MTLIYSLIPTDLKQFQPALLKLLTVPALNENDYQSQIKEILMRKHQFFLILLSVLIAFPAMAQADDYVLTLKDHQFTPAELVLPANQKVKLIVKNEQTTTAEFESADLNREKVVEANDSITVFLGPLDPGTYGYFDDFHRETTGTITVK
jgi:plastocyanin